MKGIGWALLGLMAVLQICMALEIMELSSLFKRIASIDEKTAIVKNEAAVKALETERIRATYYRVLVTSPFKLTEEEARFFSEVKE